MEISNNSGKEVKDLISDYNKQAIEFLTKNKISESFSLLKKAESLLSHISSQHRLHSITYNNLGCFYKSVNKFQPALEMFIKSLSLNNFDKSLEAGTHLNVSSILSSLGSHKKALDHGLTALNIFKKINELDSGCRSSLIFAAYASAKECESLGNLSQAESLAKFALKFSSEIGQSDFDAKLASLISSISKKSQTKPRFSSVPRRFELPSIKTIQTDYPKIFPIIEDKRKFSPKVFRTYPPILDIPYSRQQPKTSDSPTHKKAKTNISEIKKELYEYEEKFRRLTGTGKRNIKIRSAKVSQEKKMPVKLVYSVGDPKKPVSPPSIDLNRFALVIQKNWRAYKAREVFRMHRRKIAHQKAREAIEELEILKIQAQNDKLFMAEDSRPKTYSPLKIQKKEKLYRTLGKFPKSGFSLHEKLSIIKIQSFGRMAIQKMRYKRMKKAAGVIQRNIKRMQCTKLFQKITSAILFIQYQWRKTKKQSKNPAKKIRN